MSKDKQVITIEGWSAHLDHAWDLYDLMTDMGFEPKEKGEHGVSLWDLLHFFFNCGFDSGATMICLSKEYGFQLGDWLGEYDKEEFATTMKVEMSPFKNGSTKVVHTFDSREVA